MQVFNLHLFLGLRIMNESSAVKKRFEELYNRSYMQNYNTFTTFLNLEEQSILKQLNLPCSFFGGYDTAERIVAGFGEDLCNEEFPVQCLCISPVSEKFADKLTHRDFLGSLMNLGIKREMLGDIVISDKCAYLFCLEQISDYICENLIRVKHTSVKVCTCTSLPENALPEPEPVQIIVASLRIDAAVCKVFKLSRSEGSQLFLTGRVFVNSRQMNSQSHILSENDIVSVRGFGRFVFVKETGKTKKNNTVIEILKY